MYQSVENSRKPIELNSNTSKNTNLSHFHQRKAFVVGVGMTKFLKPGSHNFTYYDLGKQAVSRALIDSGISYEKVESGFVGYVFQSSCAGQRVLYEVGMTGIPIINVNNNCATGSTAFYLAVNAVKSGSNECAIALGFDQMKKGPLPMDLSEPTHPVYPYAESLIKKGKFNPKIPSAPQLFGAAGAEHMQKYNTELKHLHKISVKNYQHGLNNPYAQFRISVSEADVEKSQAICFPLNKLHCCPTSDGAACAIVCSEDFVIKNKLQDQAVEILACCLGSDKHETFVGDSAINLVGFNLAKEVSTKAYKQAGISANDVKVVELHDCFSANELITYESLGLCGEGKAKEFIDKGENTYGGKFVVNPSGGLTSKGHPLGATGIAQITELTWQLRNMAEKRQVKDVKYALAHNLGLGSAVVVSILKKYNDKFNTKEHQTSDPDKLEEIEKQGGLKKNSLMHLKNAKAKF
jgi:sterol carrier protein 2